MTTGEKLSKLRKENNYTQEKLAEILGVSRQAISKWESDGAFPETEKLIQLAKLYDCSIDYLIRNDQRIGNNEAKAVVDKNSVSDFKKEANQSLKKYLLINLPTCSYSVLGLLVMMLVFLMPIALAEVNVSPDNIFGGSDFFFGDSFHFPTQSFPSEEFTQTCTVEFNVYDIVFSSNYKLGNLIYLFAFLFQIVIAILGVVIYLANIKKVFIIRTILAYITSILWVLALVILINEFCYGLIVILAASIIYTLGMTFIKFNKYVPIIEEGESLNEQ